MSGSGIPRKSTYQYGLTGHVRVTSGTTKPRSDIDREVPQSKGVALTPDAKFEYDAMLLSDELVRLLCSKQNDYGPLNIAQSPGGPLNGLRVRLFDKVQRLSNLVDSGATPENESLEDTFKDIANYGIIGLMVLRGLWPTLEDKP